MGLKTTQTCDRCGSERTLSLKSSPDFGGWRTLNSGALEATFCNNCVREIVRQAQDASLRREVREPHDL